MRRTLPLFVAAHGRSGTHYAAALLQAGGLRVGHECYGPDGVVSWIHVGQGEIFGQVIERTTYEEVVHLVRHPLNVISSSTTMLRESFEFMRDNLPGWDHVAKVTEDMSGEDKIRFLARSWIEWNRKIERLQPVRRVRVEDLPPDGQWRDSRRALYGRPLRWDELGNICGYDVALEVAKLGGEYGYA